MANLKHLKAKFHFNIFLFLFGWTITILAVDIPNTLIGWTVGLSGAIIGAVGLINITLIAHQILWMIKLNESTSTKLWTFTITRKTPKYLYIQLKQHYSVVKVNFKKQIKKFVANIKGEVASIVIEVGISLLIAAVILPIALTTLASANFTGVDASVKTVVTILLPILAVVAIALVYFGYVKRGK